MGCRATRKSLVGTRIDPGHHSWIGQALLNSMIDDENQGFREKLAPILAYRRGLVVWLGGRAGRGSEYGSLSEAAGHTEPPQKRNRESAEKEEVPGSSPGPR
jgi:hypothetical protein